MRPTQGEKGGKGNQKDILEPEFSGRADSMDLEGRKLVNTMTPGIFNLACGQVMM